MEVVEHRGRCGCGRYASLLGPPVVSDRFDTMVAWVHRSPVKHRPV